MNITPIREQKLVGKNPFVDCISLISKNIFVERTINICLSGQTRLLD